MWSGLMMFWACTPSGEPAPVQDTAPQESRPDHEDTAPPEPMGCLDYDPAIEIGTGYSAWWPLEEGQELIMVHGPQGGWHMLCAARVFHTDPLVEISFTVTTEGGVVVADNLYQVALFPGPNECSGVYSGMYAFLDVRELEEGERDTPPELLAYQPLIIDMSVVDAQGRAASDQRIVTAVPDPADL